MFGAFDLVDVKGPNKGNRFCRYEGGASAMKLKQAMNDEGLIALFRQTLVHVAPPLITTEEELRDGFERMDRALTSFGAILESE